MGRHNSGKMNWKISDITKELFWERLIWGGVGVLGVIVLIIIIETVGGK